MVKKHGKDYLTISQAIGTKSQRQVSRRADHFRVKMRNCKKEMFDAELYDVLMVPYIRPYTSNLRHLTDPLGLNKSLYNKGNVVPILPAPAKLTIEQIATQKKNALKAQKASMFQKLFPGMQVDDIMCSDSDDSAHSHTLQQFSQEDTPKTTADFMSLFQIPHEKIKRRKKKQKK